MVWRRDDDDEAEQGVLDLCRDSMWAPPSCDSFGAMADSFDGRPPSDEGLVEMALFSFGGRPRLRGTTAGEAVGCGNPVINELAEDVPTVDGEGSDGDS